MQGKVVLITGASSGVGAGTASHFASLGCLLSLTGRDQDRLKETFKSCIQAGCKEEDVLLIPADLQDISGLSSIVQKTVDKFGKLDVLINNAACSTSKDFENTTVEEYERVMNCNLKSVFFLTQNALPHLIKSKGCVVNISSGMAERPLKGMVGYTLSKAALDHFTKMLAVDTGSKGVRVNSVSLGMIRTPIYETLGYPTLYEQTAPIRHALGRGGTVEEVSKTIAFLADNDLSSFVTGAIWLVDGGYTLMGPV